ncbi:MAG: plasmid pRiA4b ORF-3 family protein [Actinomycetota bacterium]
MSPGRSIYQLKITLRDIKPPVWRRVQVLGSSSLAELHTVIQAAFGWWDYHLHEFEIGGMRYGIDDGEGWEPPDDERRAKLGKVVPPDATFTYLYDFGDDWEHSIKVEKVVPAEPNMTYPICLGGKRARPPEDCGGPGGYAEFLEAISDPKHREHASMLEWVGGSFDPEQFDPGDFEHNLKMGPVLE